jgi:dienelactone hydrolase
MTMVWNVHAVALLAAAVACGIGCRPAAASPVFWQEAEAYTTAPRPTQDRTVDARGPASGGQVLFSCMREVGNVVTYELTLPADIPDARMLLRYARLHWQETMTPGAVEVEVKGAGEPARARLTCDNTGGWGREQHQYALASGRLGDLKAGKATLTLTVAKEADQNIDGFFLVPGSVEIEAEELSRLARLEITSDGYVGLLANSTVADQTGGARLRVAVRAFAGDPGAVRAVITDAAGKSAELAPAQAALAQDDHGAAIFDFAWPELSDGDYSLTITSDRPRTAIKADMVMVGQLKMSLAKEIGNIDGFVAFFAACDSPHRATCLADLQHAAEYLKDGQKRLAESTRDRTASEEGLAEHEGIINAAPSVSSIRRALVQTLETIERLKAGKDPYDGRTGEFRRAYRSAKDNALIPYRVLVPDSYWEASRVPFIYLLHGGGGDENEWPEMADGLLMRMLNEAGYVAVMPKWHARERPAEVDLPQLLDLATREYSRVDPDRVYCTGISMGGFGTYWLTTMYPDRFAAACCVSGTGDVSLAPKLKNVPLLIIQGEADEVVPPEGAKAMATKMKELGQTVELRLFPTYGHDYHPQQYMALTLEFFGRHRRSRDY